MTALAYVFVVQVELWLYQNTAQYVDWIHHEMKLK